LASCQQVRRGSDAIVSLEQVKGGTSAAKAAAIGVATGVGAFFATPLIILATVSD
jgi:hypothetical protein